MKEKCVKISEDARRDVEDIHEWIAEEATNDVAFDFILRLGRHFESLCYSYGRGKDLSHIRPGLRSAGFERKLTMIYRDGDSRVDILRVFYRGRDWEAIVTRWIEETD